ncbi:MAG: hypothetical protein H7Y28_14395 [Rhodoferax sp.]|nr:hypothetical protein [Rhodoferax sp.]
MLFYVKRFLVVAGVVALTACSTTPRVPLQAESKQKIKTIALVQLPDPNKYFLYPGQIPGGSALYMFGAIGGLVLGGIEASRTDSASNEFTASLSPQNPALGTHATDELAKAISDRGYVLKKVPALPNQADDKITDCSAIKGNFDAVVIATMSAGYSVESQVEPRIGIRVKLLSADCSQTLYSNSFLYASKEFSSSVFVQRDPEFSFANRDLLIAGAPKAKDGLREGVTKLAMRIAQEL